jgi:ubiquinone/menaquinone biosynthesis C-methylase UbiE
MTQTAGHPTDKGKIQSFWKAVYDTAYKDSDAKLDPETLFQAIDDLEDMFRYRDHMAVVEMPLAELAGQSVLEIGCGAGGHSALFAKHGAHMTSLDVTPERAQATAAKFLLMGDRAAKCAAINGDAEHLPFPDDHFDIVYSNGVLHHTHDTEAAIAEVFRVLKPGGRAVIMLYCKSSWAYWFNYWFCAGILTGRLFRDRNWLGHVSEWSGNTKQTVFNPITRCYTAGSLRHMFKAFSGLSLRKGEFYFYLIPKLGRIYRRYQIKRYGVHPGGRLVYGEDWPIQSKLELRLGRVMGWAWFIAARKPMDQRRP